MQTKGFIYYNFIAKVMNLARWEQIVRCLHLIDNQELVWDVTSKHFDRIAKTWWVIQMFVKVFKDIYNIEREITIGECVIPYKDRYYFIK